MNTQRQRGRGAENSLTMRLYIKNRQSSWCVVLFLLCLLARCAEYFGLRTDQTLLGENILHKVFGIAALAVLLKMAGRPWNDIGFRKERRIENLQKGLLLGGLCFAVSYGVELALLAAQGVPARLELYVSGFSLTGASAKNQGTTFFLLCLFVNLVNVWMEEGIFRGLFIKAFAARWSFRVSNLVAAALFGMWHLVMPLRSYLDGEMTFGAMVGMGCGYLVLSGLMGVKWGLLYRGTGSLWAGIGDHLFNNTIATNMLHVVTANGADEWQILRVLLAQLLSFGLVWILYRQKGRREKASGGG